jgi:putative cardiolipin synthase
MGRYLAEAAGRHPGESGFSIIRDGRTAFTARVALTELAEKSLDVQYFIWEADETGRILAERLLRAADRGVRVRVLLDDINIHGRDAVVAAMDAHPNIEIRLFNPFAYRGFPGFEYLSNFNRVNHRMHNKLMVADNAVAIVGGRNIGNHYFEVSTDANFRDLDIAAGGPVVREISSVFDHFWNGPWAVPVAALSDRPYTETDLRTAFEAVRKRISDDGYPYPIDRKVSDLKTRLTAIFDGFIWAHGSIVWDDPAAIVAAGKTQTMLESLHRRVDRLERELLVESPYFIPRDRAIQKLKALRERGVRVRVLTNSLASTDVIAAYAGYANRRKQFLDTGAELYELRPSAGSISKRFAAMTGSKAALHAKVLVFDRKDVFVGSFNLDPRSADINTEAGLYVESPELAEQVAAFMEDGVSPLQSYRVLLDDDGKLYWLAEVDGREVRLDEDPETSFWQRLQAGFIGLLPIEEQL